VQRGSLLHLCSAATAQVCSGGCLVLLLRLHCPAAPLLAPLPQLNAAPPSSAALAAVLLLVALCGVCDGLAQGALFGEVALLPPRYTQALVAGTAVSGELRETYAAQVSAGSGRQVSPPSAPCVCVPAGTRRSLALLPCTALLCSCAGMPSYFAAARWRRGAR
jgi:hypothetical protein